MYEKIIKRPLDFILALIALTVLWPLLLVLTIIGAIAMKGNPFFTQMRPGKKDKTGHERIFKLIKFRTMTNKKDVNGNLLPDNVRLNGYGKFLRNTSLDELPELINIVIGHMAVIGPRPQLVRDMVFMTDEQRKRHDVRPGLSGWAQVNGRNSIEWQDKLNYDIEYINRITFLFDAQILLLTIKKVIEKKDITYRSMATAEDYGDYLLRAHVINQREYSHKQAEAKKFLTEVAKDKERVKV